MQFYFVDIYAMFLVTANLLLSTSTANSMQEVTYRIREHPKPYQLIGNLFQSAGILETVRHVRLDSLESDWLGWFQIDRQTGDLFTRPEATTGLDHEKLCYVTVPTEHLVNPRHTCKINLLAFINKKLLVKITFVVLDINDNPPVFSGSELKVTEKKLMLDETSMPNVTKLQLPRAFDADSGGGQRLFYFMDPTFDNFRLVHLSEQSGIAGEKEELYLLLTKQLDYEKVSAYRFNLTACDNEVIGRVSNDGERHCNSLPIHISIINTNDEKPIFGRKNYSVVIKEINPVHHQILTVKASDADYPPFNQINYHMIPDRRLSHELFLVDKLTGVVTLAKQLPGPGVYHFRIIATNEEIPPLNQSVESTPLKQLTDYSGDVTTVYVHVLDTNDHAPKITLQKSAETRDYLLDIVKPKVQGFIPDDHQSVFLCVTENIKTPVTLAYFLVSDEDTGENAQINCTLLNSGYASNDSSVFSSLRLNMVSKMTIYKSVYRLTLETSIDAETFVPRKHLNLTSQMPHESRIVGFTDFSIICRDNGIPSLSGYVKIYVGVTDVDEFYPEVTITVLSNRTFLSNVKVENHSYTYNISLWEDVAIETVLLRFNITDRDAISLPRLLISSSSNNLKVNETTGELLITNLYDYESQKFDVIRLTIHEMGSNGDQVRATVWIHITLLDINDNYPVFTIPPLETTLLQPSPVYERNEKFDGIRTMTIEEEQPVDIPLGQIFAVDADTHGNGQIIFFLAEVSPVIYKQYGTEQFTNTDGIPEIIISKYGVLWSKHKLDREKTPLIDILVGAHDLGEPRLTTYTSLRITLKDINDHAPIWQFPTQTDFMVKVLKSGLSINSTITRIRATDFDVQQNAHLSYSLMAPSNVSADTDSDISLACYISQKFLAVHSQSGEIKMTNSLSKLPTGFMDVWLVVTDHGAVPRQSISKLVLYLSDSSSQLSENQLPLSYQQPSNWLVTKIRAIKSSNVVDVLDRLTGKSGRGTHLQHNGSLSMFIGAAASSFLLLFFIVCTVVLLGIRRRTLKRVKEKRIECGQNVAEGPDEKSLLREDSFIISDPKPNTSCTPAVTNVQRACDGWTEEGTMKSIVLEKQNFPVVSQNSSVAEIIECSCTENRIGNIIKPYSMMNTNGSLSTAYATSNSAFDLSTSTIPLSIVTISPEIFPVAACVTDMETVHSEMLKFPNLFTSVVPVCRVPPDFIPSNHYEKRRHENPSVFNLKPVLFTKNMNKTECVMSLNVPLQSVARSHEND